MELMEKTVESRVLFEGKIITVRLDKADHFFAFKTEFLLFA